MVAKIQYIEQVIANYRRAAEASLDNPARQGGQIHLTPDVADEVMVTGDLHGHRRNFNLIRRIAALDRRPRRHVVFQEVCHGGPAYEAGGGCMSHTVLEDLARLKTEFPEQVHFILGNHELAELTDYPIQKNRQLLNLLFRMGLQKTYGPATEKVREAYSEFLLSCPLGVRVAETTLICHSIPEFADARAFDPAIFDRPLDLESVADRGPVFRLVWGRDYRPANARAFAEAVGARVVINGHEPCPEGFSVPNATQIILDCSGDNACYLLFPVGPAFTQAELVARVRRL